VTSDEETQARAGILGHLWGPPISEMWGRYWQHLSDLTNRTETPPFSPAGPHISRESYSQNCRVLYPSVL
jgi:hypothetical protein